MSGLRKILQRHYRPIGLAGGEAQNQQALIDDLDAHYRFNARLSIVVLMAIGLAISGLAAVAFAQSRLDWKTFVGALATLVTAAVALLEVARRTVRECSQARLLKLVARNLTPEQTLQLITKVLENKS